MNSSKNPRFLLDVNVLIALAFRSHVHNELVRTWFYASPKLQWAVCAFTESGFLRNATAPRPGQITLREATEILREFRQHPGYLYLPIQTDWHTLSAPFTQRVYGTKQVTNSYLLGLALQNDLVLVTMDKAILHLAGSQHKHHVLILGH